MSVANLILLAGGAFVGSVLAAVAGFGGAAVLLPLLVAAFGVREATAHTGVVAEFAHSIGAGPIDLGLADEVRGRGDVVDVSTMF